MGEAGREPVAKTVEKRKRPRRVKRSTQSSVGRRKGKHQGLKPELDGGTAQNEKEEWIGGIDLEKGLQTVLEDQKMDPGDSSLSRKKKREERDLSQQKKFSKEKGSDCGAERTYLEEKTSTERPCRNRAGDNEGMNKVLQRKKISDAGRNRSNIAA